MIVAAVWICGKCSSQKAATSSAVITGVKASKAGLRREGT